MGAEALSESFLESEAQAEARLIQQEEEQLSNEQKITELEKNKFIEIVTESEKELVDQEIKEQQDEQVKEKEEDHEFKPNVFENVDASTGKKIENFEITHESLDTPSQTSIA